MRDACGAPARGPGAPVAALARTRTKRCCKDPHAPDRFVSEAYPIAAPLDLRSVPQAGGAISRLDGREPVAYPR